jgi:hypothetical protein
LVVVLPGGTYYCAACAVAEMHSAPDLRLEQIQLVERLAPESIATFRVAFRLVMHANLLVFVISLPFLLLALYGGGWHVTPAFFKTLTAVGGFAGMLTVLISFTALFLATGLRSNYLPRVVSLRNKTLDVQWAVRERLVVSVRDIRYQRGNTRSELLGWYLPWKPAIVIHLPDDVCIAVGMTPLGADVWEASLQEVASLGPEHLVGCRSGRVGKDLPSHNGTCLLALLLIAAPPIIFAAIGLALGGVALSLMSFVLGIATGAWCAVASSYGRRLVRKVGVVQLRWRVVLTFGCLAVSLAINQSVVERQFWPNDVIWLLGITLLACLATLAITAAWFEDQE